jgi:DNA-directed RNA polymerase specialized sigma subunit
LIQEGSKGLIAAVDKLEESKIQESPDEEKTLKSFFSKRIKGAIRRSIDIARGHIRIPEHKLNEMRQNPENKKMVEIFFNSIFLSIDEQMDEEGDNYLNDIPDRSEPYNLQFLNIYLKGLLQKHLNGKEYEVLRLSYGLDCDKHPANDIADIVGIEGPSAYVRISEIKKAAIQKLIDNVDSSQVLDYL